MNIRKAPVDGCGRFALRIFDLRRSNPKSRRGESNDEIFDPRSFSSEVDTGSREENASKQQSRAPVLIQSEPKL